MAKGERKIRNGIIISVSSAAIIGVAQVAVPGGWVAVFRATGSFFKATWKWVWQTTAIPNWLLILFSLSALVAVAVVAVLVLVAIKAKEAPDYTEDTFEGLRWRWRWGQSGLYGLNAFCPHCDYQVFGTSLGWSENHVSFRCEECSRDLSAFNCSSDALESRITRKIQQKVRAMDKQVLEK